MPVLYGRVAGDLEEKMGPEFFGASNNSSAIVIRHNFSLFVLLHCLSVEVISSYSAFSRAIATIESKWKAKSLGEELTSNKE